MAAGGSRADRCGSRSAGRVAGPVGAEPGTAGSGAGLHLLDSNSHFIEMGGSPFSSQLHLYTIELDRLNNLIIYLKAHISLIP